MAIKKFDARIPEKDIPWYHENNIRRLSEQYGFSIDKVRRVVELVRESDSKKYTKDNPD